MGAILKVMSPGNLAYKSIAALVLDPLKIRYFSRIEHALVVNIFEEFEQNRLGRLKSHPNLTRIFYIMLQINSN